MEAHFNKGQAILRTLVENCLLKNVGNEREKMHDLARDMTKLITHKLLCFHVTLRNCMFVTALYVVLTSLGTFSSLTKI
ncbi:disease resistance protein [Gossypium australe]|uniref:Disease resistance protein n=1 Tax=Gossypium australe TaxID=47621 RepID=A0A5B6VTK1_9ROSI|nr:disease resistance protein [Gossypium australe]